MQQISLIQQILQQTNRSDVKNTLNELEQAIQKLNFTKDINVTFLEKCLNIVEQTVLTKIYNLTNLEQNRSNDIRLAFELQKINRIIEFIPFAAQKQFDTIFNQPNYIQIQNIEVIKLDETERTQQQLKSFYSKIELGHAYINSGSDYQSKIIQQIVKNSKALYYLTNDEETELKATQIVTNPTLDHALALWRIIDNSKIVKTGYKFQLENVKIKKIIYIPRLFKQITLDSLFEKTNESIDMPKWLLYQTAFKDIMKKNNNYDIRVRVMSNKKIFRSNVNNQEIIRIINHLTQSNLQININQKIQQIKESLNLFNNCCVSSRNEIGELGLNTITNVIIHIHGGGFIAMSSFSHQSYTRQWVNQLKDSIVFSIDYRLAPEHPFPNALDDCWQYYMWIVHFSQAYMNVIPQNIILTGDSAGGNLAMAILIRAIETGQRKPDKIILQYPAMNLNLQDIVPSNLLAMDDKMIPLSLLILCRECYLQSIESHKNYYASPTYVPSEVLKQFPKDFVIFVGKDDVLVDNSIEFVHYCNQQGFNSIKLVLFENLPHGFLNMGLKSNAVIAAQRANIKIIEQLKQFIN